MNKQYTLRLENIEAELDRWLPEKPGAEWAGKVFPNLGDKANIESLQSLSAPAAIFFRGGESAGGPC